MGDAQPEGSGAPRSNSFNLIPRRDVLRAAGQVCPLRDRPGRGDPSRELYLRLRDRMRCYGTDTNDFAEAELRAVRNRYGQLYADVSGKLFPDDFSKDLRKLRLSRECLTCDALRDCPGCYRAAPADVFGPDDAVVREHLAGLGGDVLDIGCGEGPYAATLAANDRIRYLGVDPDAGAIRLLRSRYPAADYHCGTVTESLADNERRFDAVLVLRSFNHLPDPRRDIERAVERLRVGGTLLVVDNVAFGLVREHEHAIRAESGPGRFEHFRNDDADAAAACLKGLPLRLLERRDTTPTTSNQWLLRYERLTEDA